MRAEAGASIYLKLESSGARPEITSGVASTNPNRKKWVTPHHDFASMNLPRCTYAVHPAVVRHAGGRSSRASVNISTITVAGPGRRKSPRPSRQVIDCCNFEDVACGSASRLDRRGRGDREIPTGRHRARRATAGQDMAVSAAISGSCW